MRQRRASRGKGQAIGVRQAPEAGSGTLPHAWRLQRCAGGPGQFSGSITQCLQAPSLSMAKLGSFLRLDVLGVSTAIAPVACIWPPAPPPPFDVPWQASCHSRRRFPERHCILYSSTMLLAARAPAVIQPRGTACSSPEQRQRPGSSTSRISSGRGIPGRQSSSGRHALAARAAAQDAVQGAAAADVSDDGAGWFRCGHLCGSQRSPTRALDVSWMPGVATAGCRAGTRRLVAATHASPMLAPWPASCLPAQHRHVCPRLRARSLQRCEQ